jgi:hypothetical protein
MNIDIFLHDRLEVAPVAPVGLASARHPKIGATRASAEHAVAPRNSLATQDRSQRGHRGHLRSKGYGNPASSNRGRVARSILYKEMAPVAPVASRLISQWFSRGHLSFAGGPGGPSTCRARAPP